MARQEGAIAAAGAILSPLMDEATLDLEEAARLLSVAPDTVRRWLRQGLLHPSAAGQRFERAALEQWARDRGLTLASARPRRAGHPADLLADALERGAVQADVEVADASQAIRLAVDGLPELVPDQRERLVEEVLAREGMASTAMGYGVALPHPRTPPGDVVDVPLVSAVFPRSPLDWAALDGERVHTVLLLLSPNAPAHLEILSRVAYTLRLPGLPEFLRARPDKDALLDRLRSIHREDS